MRIRGKNFNFLENFANVLNEWSFQPIFKLINERFMVWPIFDQSSHLIPPENTRKLKRKWEHWSEMGFPWTPQDANWTYIRRSEDVQRLMYFQFTSFVQGERHLCSPLLLNCSHNVAFLLHSRRWSWWLLHPVEIST